MGKHPLPIHEAKHLRNRGEIDREDIGTKCVEAQEMTERNDLVNLAEERSVIRLEPATKKRENFHISATIRLS